MGKIEKIIKKGSVEGQTTEVYPVTSTKAVYDENNKRLDNIITGLKESVYLNTPISISTDNTPESIAQNVKNISDYIEKAKAAGIADVNGMGVTCLIDDYFSGVGYIFGNTNVSIQGIKIPDDIVNNAVFTIVNGRYDERFIVGVDELDKVTSNMLVQGARKPIILTSETTEVDEETYQKLLSDNVDVVFKASNEIIYPLYSKEQQEHSNNLVLIFAFPVCLTGPNTEITNGVNYTVRILPTGNHSVTITQNTETRLSNYLSANGYVTGDVVYKNKLTPILQEIDLTGTDADRKAKLDQFAVDWKALTGADTLDGAKFVGHFGESYDFWGIFIYNSWIGEYSAIAISVELGTYQVFISPTGTIISDSLLYHLTPVIIRTGNTDSDMANNVAAIKEYTNNLTDLGVNIFSFTIPVFLSNKFCGYLVCNEYKGDGYVLSGTVFFKGIVKSIVIDGTGRYEEIVDITGTNPLNTTSDNMVDAINEVNTLAKSKGNGTITEVKMNGVSKGTSGVVDLGTVITSHQDISGKADKSAAIGSLSLSLDSTNYRVTLSGTKVDGTTFTVSNVIDLPLESVVVNGSYNNTTKKVVLTLQSGSTVEFSVADLVSGLQSEITSTNKLSADLIADGMTNKVVTASEKTTWNRKQDALTNADVLTGITSTKVSNWDNAATNSHTHSNKSVLDGISSTDITNWNSKTDNVGTVTGVKMNGTTNNPTNGVVDLGTVLTEHQDISGKQDKTDNALATTAKTVTSAINEINTKVSNIPTVNNPKVSIKMNGAEKGSFTLNQASAGEVDLGTVITAHQDISGKVDKTLNAKAFEGIIIQTSNTAEAANANKAAIQAYVDNLIQLGVDTTKGFNVSVKIGNFYGCLTGRYSTEIGHFLSGTIFSVVGGEYYIKDIYIAPAGQYMELVDIQNDNYLDTTSQDLIGAINEVNTLAKNKQDKITIDTSMSDTSMNPVQNKVIKAYIDGLVGNVAAQLAQI